MAPTIVSHDCATTVVAPPFQPVVLPSKAHGSVYEIVTEQVIKQLESGVAPWRKPWRTEMPMSLASLRPYRGLNVFLLATQGYTSRYWLTFNQCAKLGGHVKRGEHSTLVTFWKNSPYKKHNAETGEDETRQGFLLRYFRVFNLEQTEGIADRLGLTGASPRVPSIETCERIVSEMPSRPRFESSNAAWYRPLTDTIGIPHKEKFESAETYYATLFHELGHSTGHPAYLQSWISRLRGDSRLLVSAASAAQKAADYILGKQEQPIQEDGDAV
jgi:antirestriction protein ArdC